MGAARLLRGRVIQNWKSRDAQAVFEGRSPKGFPADLVKATRRRLERLDTAVTIDDLRVPPGHRLRTFSHFSARS